MYVTTNMQLLVLARQVLGQNILHKSDIVAGCPETCLCKCSFSNGSYRFEEVWMRWCRETSPTTTSGVFTLEIGIRIDSAGPRRNKAKSSFPL